MSDDEQIAVVQIAAYADDCIRSGRSLEATVHWIRRELRRLDTLAAQHAASDGTAASVPRGDEPPPGISVVQKQQQ